MIHSMILHYWSGSEMYLTPFWGVKVKKLPKASLNSYFLLLSKHLKLQNSGTTNQAHTKLGPGMYHLNTFRLPRNEGVNQ